MVDHSSCEHSCPISPVEIPNLTEAQIEAIAERAAEVAIERVYTQIGRSVVGKVLWLVGAGSIALYAWLNSKGKL